MVAVERRVARARGGLAVERRRSGGGAGRGFEISGVELHRRRRRRPGEVERDEGEEGELRTRGAGAVGRRAPRAHARDRDRTPRRAHVDTPPMPPTRAPGPKRRPRRGSAARARSARRHPSQSGLTGTTILTARMPVPVCGRRAPAAPPGRPSIEGGLSAGARPPASIEELDEARDRRESVGLMAAGARWGGGHARQRSE